MILITFNHILRLIQMTYAGSGRLFKFVLIILPYSVIMFHLSLLLVVYLYLPGWYCLWTCRLMCFWFLRGWASLGRELLKFWCLCILATCFSKFWLINPLNSIFRLLILIISILQLSHTLTRWSKYPLTYSRLSVQAWQKTSPHFRQWYFHFSNPNWVVHPWHYGARSLGVHFVT